MNLITERNEEQRKDLHLKLKKREEDDWNVRMERLYCLQKESLGEGTHYTKYIYL